MTEESKQSECKLHGETSCTSEKCKQRRCAADSSCKLTMDHKFDPVIWGKFAWSLFYYVGSRIDSITDDAFRRDQQQQFMDWIQFMIPCDECTEHYRSKLSAFSPIAWIKKYNQLKDHALHKWFSHVRFLIEQEMWRMREKTMSKLVLVEEYEQRKQRTKELDLIYDKQIEPKEMIIPYFHLLFASYDPVSKNPDQRRRAVMITRIIEWFQSPLMAEIAVAQPASYKGAQATNADAALVPMLGRWIINETDWDSRCDLLTSFHRYVLNVAITHTQINEYHSKLTSQHASIKCKCSQ